MPTENRSSNTEMVSFPRELSDDLAELIATRARVCGGGAFEIWEAICEGFGKPAEQNYGEPVALPCRHVHKHHGCFLSERQHGWNACLDEIAKLGPLYTRPVQVEPAMWANQLGDTITDKVKTHNLSLGDAPAAIAKSYTQPLYTHPAPADPGEVERLRAALKFYADREHYHFESGNWDTVSGEPLNILWCGEEPDFIEDGTVARAALERQS